MQIPRDLNAGPGIHREDSSWDFPPAVKLVYVATLLVLTAAGVGLTLQYPKSPAPLVLLVSAIGWTAFFTKD